MYKTCIIMCAMMNFSCVLVLNILKFKMYDQLSQTGSNGRVTEKPIADPHSKIGYVKPTYKGSKLRTQASRIKTPTNNVRRSTSTKGTVWFPRARIALKLGPFNLMLYLVMLIAYAPFYTTVIETKVNDSRRKAYRKGKFLRMKKMC